MTTPSTSDTMSSTSSVLFVNLSTRSSAVGAPPALRKMAEISSMVTEGEMRWMADQISRVVSAIERFSKVSLSLIGNRLLGVSLDLVWILRVAERQCPPQIFHRKQERALALYLFDVNQLVTAQTLIELVFVENVNCLPWHG